MQTTNWDLRKHVQIDKHTVTNTTHCTWQKGPRGHNGAEHRQVMLMTWTDAAESYYHLLSDVMICPSLPLDPNLNHSSLPVSKPHRVAASKSPSATGHSLASLRKENQCTASNHPSWKASQVKNCSDSKRAPAAFSTSMSPGNAPPCHSQYVQ